MDQHDMPREPKTVRVTLVSRYDRKEATIRARRATDGRLFLTARQLDAARVRARLVTGDYWNIPEQVWIVD